MTTIPSQRLIEALKTMQISKSGYGGVLPNGTIVDRREHPEAMPIQANKSMGVPKPKSLPKQKQKPLPSYKKNTKQVRDIY